MKGDRFEIGRREFLVAGAAALASIRFGSIGWAAQERGNGLGFSDSHAHLDSFPEEDLVKIIAAMRENNVSLVMNVSINLLTSAEAVRIAQANEGIYAAVGIHPGEAVPLTSDVKKKLEELSGRDKVVAFGEVGLNYGSSTGSNEEQRELLLFQKSLADNLHIPLDIHCGTDAYKECAEMLKGSAGIIHGFSGTMEDLNTWLDIGYYISLGEVRSGESGGAMGPMGPGPGLSEEVVRAIPEERLITETDCMARVNSRWSELGKASGPPAGASGAGLGGPDSGRDGAAGGPAPGGGMPPQGGMPGGIGQEQSNGPVDVIKVAESIAKIRGVSAEEIGNIATRNLKRVLNV